jgi:hypothetical protein
VLETDKDVSEMSKTPRMANRTQAEGRVRLGTVVLKRLQTLIWWIRDQKKRGLALSAAEFTAETMMSEAAEMKTLFRERSDKEPSITRHSRNSTRRMTLTRMKMLSEIYWRRPLVY